MAETEKNIAALAGRFVNNTDRHVFLTGKAGTGKTTFLRHITKSTHKNAVIAAPTGVAAINAGGITLHSLFQLPFGAFVPVQRHQGGYGNFQINDKDSLVRGLRIMGNKRRLLQELELLIIDEVSMLRADLLDAIDTVLRVVRRNGRMPFGGVQVLFIGDLLQLPPVVKDQEWQVLSQYYKSPYFFDAQCLQNGHKPLYLELDKVYRQQDNTFINVLNNLRHNVLSAEDTDLLNRHYKQGFKPSHEDSFIQLTTHNSKADSINREALQRLPGKSVFFKAEVTKDYPEHMYPIDETLELKLNAQVMFIKNDISGEKRYYNGKIGKVTAIDNTGFEVTFEDSAVPVRAEKYEWQNIRYRFNEITNQVDEETLGTFSHFPVRLAWAITIHKSQGLTFQKAILDLGGAFAPGQVYVALSRLVSLNGLVLSSPIPNQLPEQDKAISGFAGTKSDRPLEEVLTQDSQAYLKSSLRRCFDFTSCANQFREHMAGYGSDDQKTVRQKHISWAAELQELFKKEQAVAAKFTQQLDGLLQQQPIDLETLEARIVSAGGYFGPAMKELSRRVLAHITEVQQEKQTKKYQADLLLLEGQLYKLQQNIDKATALIRSFKEGTELTRNDFSSDESRLQVLEHAKTAKERNRSSKEPGTKKVPGQTQAESFKLYMEGKTLEEIAAIRGYAITTIEGHLARYVTSGHIPVEKFLAPEKLEQIITVANTVGADQLSPVKAALGDEFTYADIRFAMAELKRREAL